MNFFGGSVVSIGVFTSPMLPEEEELPNSLLDTIRGAIVRKEDIVDNIMITAATNFANKINHYFGYGKTTYYRELPTAASSLVVVDTAALKAIYDAIEGEPVTIVSASHGGLDPITFGNVHLQDTYNWNSTDNLITVGADTFARTSTEFIPEIQGNPNQDPIQAQVLMAFVGVSNPGLTYTERVFYVTDEGGYYSGRYSLDSSPTYYTYFYLSTTDNPDLAPPVEVDSLGEYFPIALLREQFIDIDREENLEHESFLTTKELLHKLDIDLVEMMDSIRESPDIANVRGAFFTLSIDMSTEREDSNKYLYAYFERVSRNTTNTKASFEAAIDAINSAPADARSAPPTEFVEIKENTYNKIINFNYIDVNIIAGVVGEVGEVVKTLISRPPTNYDFDDEYNSSPGFTVINSEYVFQFQDTETTYVQVNVHGLITTTVIAGRYNTSIENDILIPVNTYDLLRFGTFEKEAIMLDSMQIVIYAYQETELKWYQTEAFKLLLIVVAVVAAVFTGPQTLAAFTAAFTSIAGIINLVIVFATFYAVTWVAKQIGGALGIAFLIASYFILPTSMGGLGGSLDAFSSVQVLLQLSTASMSIVTYDLEQEFDEFNREQQEFQDQLEDKQEELDQALDLLGDGNFAMNPLYFVSSTAYFDTNETPSGFYSRTLNQNPGDLSLAAIDTFNDSALDLPNVQDFTSSNEELNGNLDWFNIN